MDSELGAKFEFNGTTLKVVKGKLCYGCYFTKELAEEFLNNFRDLIVKAGDLI